MSKFCTNCGNELSSSAEFCSKCGKPVHIAENNASQISTPPTTNNNGLAIVGSAAGGILAFMLVIFLISALFLYNNYDEVVDDSELSIGNVSLGQSVSTKKNSTGGVEIKSTDGTIITHLIAQNSNPSTKRGIHIGSTESEMINSYGKDYKLLDLDELKIYQYSFNTASGTPGILEFTVNTSSRIVVKISARLVKG